MDDRSVVLRILDLARWAPSGDNTQPWRFQIASDSHVVVHGFDTRDHCVYDLDGHPSQISIGALLETLSIAASLTGCAPTSSAASTARRQVRPSTFDSLPIPVFSPIRWRRRSRFAVCSGDRCDCDP